MNIIQIRKRERRGEKGRKGEERRGIKTQTKNLNAI
jgi:hypothetical protein